MPNDIGSAPRRLRMELAPLRDLSPSFVDELAAMGFSTLSDFRGRQTAALTRAYCQFAKRPLDPVMRACFVALIGFAESGIPTPVWRIMRAEAILDREKLVTSVHSAG